MAESCPSVAAHTKAPESYLAWHEWAAEMSAKGWTQELCPDCLRYKIWVPPVAGRSVVETEQQASK